MPNAAELFMEITYTIERPVFCAKLLTSFGNSKSQSFGIYNKIFEEGKKGDYSVFIVLGDDRSIDYLRTSLLHNDIGIKDAILTDLIESRYVIEELLDILLYLLEQENDSDIPGIQWTISNLLLPKVGLKALKPMLKFLKNENIDLEARESAAFAFVRSTPEAITFLITDNSIPPSIIEAISESSYSMDINEFIELLKYDKIYALIAIRGIENPDPKVLPLLIKLLEDNDPSIRSSTMYTLGLIGNKIGNLSVIVEHILKLLKDDDKLVRTSAAIALEDLCDPRTIEPLLELLKKNDSSAQVAPAFALAPISTKAYDSVKDRLLKAYRRSEISCEALEIVIKRIERMTIRNPDAWIQYHLRVENKNFSYTSYLASDDINKVSNCCRKNLKIGNEAIAILNQDNEKESIHSISCPEVKAAYWS